MATLRRVFLFGIATLALLCVAGAAYESLAWHAEAARYPHPGHLVNGLNLYCTGQGSPTVLLEAGFGDSLETWTRVQPDVARFARVCSYDRAGYGYSDPGPMPRTADRVATEFHAALRAAGERPPYLLAGHSFGGFLVRVFNGLYPDEVSGLVLVDSTQEDQYRLLPPAWARMGDALRRRTRRQALWAPLYVGLGIARLQLAMQGVSVAPVILQAKYLKARASELANIEVSAAQARDAGHIDGKPLVVLTGGRAIDSSLKAALSVADQQAYQETWVNDIQPRLARLSSRGVRVLVPDSGHDMPSDRPDAIVSAVRDLCDGGLKAR